MEKYILIKSPGIETVVAQLGPNPTDNEIPETTVYYPAEKKRVIVRTTSTRIVNADGSQQISIQYSPGNNADLVNNQNLARIFGRPDSWYWGTSTIAVSAGLDLASAVWTDRRPKYNGNAQQCTVLPQAPLEKKEREVVSRVERRQAAFRELLLSMDDCCSITGEQTDEVLDAAHIIAASDTVPNRLAMAFYSAQTYTACTTQDASRFDRMAP